VFLPSQVDTLEEAIQLVNSNPYGNGTAIFTDSGSAARRFQHDVQVSCWQAPALGSNTAGRQASLGAVLSDMSMSKTIMCHWLSGCILHLVAPKSASDGAARQRNVITAG
jgi:hypothetical protein